MATLKYKSVLGLQAFPTHNLDEMEVLVQEDYMMGMTKIVNAYKETEEGMLVLKYYMIWRILDFLYPDRPHDEVKRRERCLKETEEAFAPAITAMFIRSKGIDMSGEVIQQVDAMVDIMQAAFRENLPHVGWMSADSQGQAEKKIEHMVDLIGYPKFVLNNTWLNGLYEDLDISHEQYLVNVVSHR